LNSGQQPKTRSLTLSADVRCVTDAVRHSDCVVVCTDWDEFKSIDWLSMASEMQVIFPSMLRKKIVAPTWLFLPLFM